MSSLFLARTCGSAVRDRPRRQDAGKAAEDKRRQATTSKRPQKSCPPGHEVIVWVSAPVGSVKYPPSQDLYGTAASPLGKRSAPFAPFSPCRDVDFFLPFLFFSPSSVVGCLLLMLLNRLAGLVRYYETKRLLLTFLDCSSQIGTDASLLESRRQSRIYYLR